MAYEFALLKIGLESWLNMIFICFRKIEEIWFSVALNEKKEVLSTGLSSGSGKKCVQTVLKNVPSHMEVQAGNGSAINVIETLHKLLLGYESRLKHKLDLSQTSQFKRKVYSVVGSIPKGFVSTYGAVARLAGLGKSYRAIGSALASNPFILLVPCHRVVNSNLEVGQYSLGVEMKRKILVREGVKFDGRRVSPESLWNPRLQTS